MRFHPLCKAGALDGKLVQVQLERQPLAPDLFVGAPVVEPLPLFLPGEEALTGLRVDRRSPRGIVAGQPVQPANGLSPCAEEGWIPVALRYRLSGREVHRVGDPDVGPVDRRLIELALGGRPEQGHGGAVLPHVLQETQSLIQAEQATALVFERRRHDLEETTLRASTKGIDDAIGGGISASDVLEGRRPCAEPARKFRPDGFRNGNHGWPPICRDDGGCSGP